MSGMTFTCVSDQNPVRIRSLLEEWEEVAQSREDECNVALDRVNLAITSSLRGQNRQIYDERNKLLKEQEVLVNAQKICRIMGRNIEVGLGKRELIVCQNEAEEVFGIAVYETDFEPTGERGESLGKHLKLWTIVTNPQLLLRVKGVGTTILQALGKMVLERDDIEGIYCEATYLSEGFYKRFGAVLVENITNKTERSALSMILSRSSIETNL